MKGKYFSKIMCVLLAFLLSFNGLLIPRRTVVKAETSSSIYAKLAEAPKDGDTVLIVHTSDGNVLGSAASGNKLASVAGIVEEDKLTYEEGMAKLKVTVSDGVYVFTNEEGKYLTSGETGNALTFEAEDSDLAKWTVEAQADGTFYIINNKAEYRGTKQALEYYNGFTTYGVKADNAAYKFDFYSEAADGGSEEGGTVEVEEGLVTDLSALKDGDQIVIVNKANAMALSQNYNGFYNEGEAVTISEDKVTNATETMLWTVGINEASDGSRTYTFSTAEGKKLSMGASYSSMPLDDVNTEWKIEAAASEGCFYIINVARNLYMEWYDKNNNWSAYKSVTDEALFAQQLYKATKAEDVEPEPDPEPPTSELYEKLTEITDGSTVIIVHKDSNYVLTAEADGKKLKGMAGTITDDKLAYEEGMAKLTVTVNEGVYVFTNEEGKYLTSGETGNALSFEAEDSDLAKWTVEVQEDGTFYVINNKAEYRGNKQALEYYNGFTTYGVKADNAAYKFDFYGEAAEPAEEVEEGLVTDLSTLKDGDQVVIVNKANAMALSQNYDGFYNAGETVTISEDKVVDPSDTMIWTVGIIEVSDGSRTYTFSTADGKKLSMGASYSSMPLDDVNTEWKIEKAATEDCFYIINVARNLFMEWYAKNNNWSSYRSVTDEALFAQQFYKVTRSEDIEPEIPEGPQPGKQYVIYNANAAGVIGKPLDETNTSMSLAPATIEDGIAICENGALVVTVGYKDGLYYFESNGKYLATDNSESLYLADALSNTEECDTYWTLKKQEESYIITSTKANYSGTPVVIEFFAGHFSGWTYKSTTPELFLFDFYPIGEDNVIYNGMVNNVRVIFDSSDDAIVNADYTVEFHLDDISELDTELTVTYQIGDKEYTAEAVKGPEKYSFEIPAEHITEPGTIKVKVVAHRSDNVEYSGETEINISSSLFFSNQTPGPRSETGDDKRPVISVKVTNAGEDFTVKMLINDQEVEAAVEGTTISWQSEEDMADGRVNVHVEVTTAAGETGETSWYFTIGKQTMSLYFGQLHSHTTYSDGAGSLESALDYIASLPLTANVQFVAFTDHSNYFDTTSAANPEQALYNMSLASKDAQAIWEQYKTTAAEFNAKQSNIIAIAGFEMTWSGGPGHINTFNTPGFVSRNNSTLNNKTNDAGLRTYYALLSQEEGKEALSQFNHPGNTFGNFVDFAYWDAIIDSRMYLVEVGNGEGQIGQGGYYPSYDQYNMALDKGWHVAPTNNQDNHKGRWGNANEARDVILTDNFTEEGIYEAIKARRIYATEDRNLELYYTVNGYQLGTIISEVPEELNFSIEISDPDRYDVIKSVELVANSGQTIYNWDDEKQLSSGKLTVTMPPEYTYYYVRVTQTDGDIAVTAPVWVGETLKLGISDFSAAAGMPGTAGADIQAMPVTGEELYLVTTLFNSESDEATVTSLTYTINGSQVIGTDTNEYTIPASSTLQVGFPYTPTEAKVMTITVTAVIYQDGKQFTYTKELTLDVSDAEKMIYIGIDASHHNEYVYGNYRDSMGNFTALAQGKNVRAVTLTTSEELLAATENEKYMGIILTAPSRRNGNSLRNPYDTYSDAEIAALKAFNEKGGMLILAGWGDYYEKYETFPAEDHMAAQQNKILEAVGSHLRISDDELVDDELNGGQNVRLYFSNINLDSPLMKGVVIDEANPNSLIYSELYSNYGGASVYAVDDNGNVVSTLPENVEGVVYGHASTYTVDNDADGLGGNSPKYPFKDGSYQLALATEKQEGKGWIIVAGSAFMSNFEVQAAASSGSSDSDTEKNYSNYKLCENLLDLINPVEITPISEVRAQNDEGYKYTIEGIVTSNASGYDKETAFFDCIYIQDETGGICIFPVSGNYKIGDKVRVTGTTDWYQGEPELQVINIAKIEDADPVEPQEVTSAQITDRSFEGSLVKLTGTVESYELDAEGLVQTIMVKDAEGNIARVFIDGYITVDKVIENLEEQNEITVTGQASYDDTFNAPYGPFPRIRVRDRADVICTVNENKEYQIIEGNGSTYTKGSSEDLLIVSNAPFAKFDSVEVDGEVIEGYDAAEGSTEITLHPEYLETLTEGEHTIVIKATDGQAEGTFNIAEEAAEPQPVDPDTPATGDNPHLGAYTVALVTSLIGISIILRKKRND